MIRVLLLLSLCGLLIAACGDTADREARVGFGDPFPLAVDGATEVGGEVTVRFVAVTNDSRCPADVVCIVAGEATVLLHLTVPDGTVHQIEVIAPGPGSSATAGGFEVTILGLIPDPPPAGGPDPSTYRATLVVSPADS